MSSNPEPSDTNSIVPHVDENARRDDLQNRSPVDLPETDRGPRSISGFNYEFSYITMLSIQMYLGQNNFNELLCELHDDVLGVLNNSKFVAIQIKSRDISLGPFRYTDTPIKDSIKKFVQLEKKFPNQFEEFQIISNVGFSSTSRQNITTLITESRSPVDNRFSNLSLEFIQKISQDCEVEPSIVIRVLQKLNPILGPSLDNIDQTILGRNLLDLQREFEIIPNQLDETYKKIKQIVMEKCRIEIPDLVEEYRSLLTGDQIKKIHELVNQKRITPETIGVILKDGLRTPYLHLRDRLPYQIDDDSIDLMRRKLGLGGIDPLVTENLVMLEHSAEHFILKEYNKNRNPAEVDSKIDHILSTVQDISNGIRSREMESSRPFGTRMLHKIEDELRRISDENPSEFLGTPVRILKGFVGMLTASCKVAFSEVPSGGFR